MRLSHCRTTCPHCCSRETFSSALLLCSAVAEIEKPERKRDADAASNGNSTCHCLYFGIEIESTMDFTYNGLNAEDFGVCPPATPCESPSSLLPSPTSAYSGRILCSLINAIFVDFVDEDTGQSCLARCTPGKMYLNGKRNLLSLLRTPSCAAALLPPGTPVRMRVAKAAKEQKLIFFKDEYGNQTVALDSEESTKYHPMKRMLRMGKEKTPRTCSHVVVQMWSEAWGNDLAADMLKLPNRQFLQTMSSFDGQADSMLLRLHECVLESDLERKKTLQAAVAAAITPWFLVDHLGPLARSVPRWPETPANMQPIRATVAELHRYSCSAG